MQFICPYLQLKWRLLYMAGVGVRAGVVRENPNHKEVCVCARMFLCVWVCVCAVMFHPEE